ncbi:hypothetical protein B4U45_18340 [Mycobacterium persicum]|uniref:Helix-turn-helix domain-containing protein n=2 Tax=Mycobacterium persicum TaxID=1487726 RepID=A0A8E2LPJ8_9MYCO|nr:hypothetical protein A4G31_17215 [Mycobacterium persicum]ORB40471.1 hypothetical protein BST40_21925 [Mycobacterium persicum]ORC08268.1 hypothetical protein B4U45_18340 [Mycobacterium persicum]
MSAATMNPVDTECAYYCAAHLIRHRQRSGQPIPEWLRRHYDRLDAEIRVMSAAGHESGRAAAELEKRELVTAEEAAAVLGISKRQVRRLASDLDGQLIGGRWLFRLCDVQTYAEGRQSARSAVSG